jgi:hypothetical protein
MSRTTVTEHLPDASKATLNDMRMRENPSCPSPKRQLVSSGFFDIWIAVTNPRPTDAGKIPLRAACTGGIPRIDTYAAVRSIVMMALGRSIPNKLIAIPRIPAVWRPTRMVRATKLMPGVIWQSAQSRLNSSSVSQPSWSTAVRRIKVMVVVPPPND